MADTAKETCDGGALENKPMTMKDDFRQSLLLLMPLFITVLAVAASLYLLREKTPPEPIVGQQIQGDNEQETEPLAYQPDEMQAIIERLAQGESENNPRAINWKDRDGTASFGCLQFKPTSFREYGIKYGYFGEEISWNWLMTAIFDCELQKQIARHMISDPNVDKNKEWPVQWHRISGKK